MRLDDDALDTLFRNARSQNGWRPDPVTDADLRAIFDLAKLGPTSANCSPMRVVFVRTPEGRERLRPALLPSNVDKVMTAPAVAIIGHDLRFFDAIPRLFPHNPSARDWFAGDDKRAIAEVTAFRNGSLQGAYLMLAARALGFDVGPMSGFDNAKVDAEFFAGTSIRTNFLCGIGHGDPAKVYARSPRLAFEEACTLA
jgi:3-hydroxypropanoate dehydrogenase